jgi:hypothetical protein
MLMAVVVLWSPMHFAHAVDVQSSVQLGSIAGPTCGLKIVSGSPIIMGNGPTTNALSTGKTLSSKYWNFICDKFNCVRHELG